MIRTKMMDIPNYFKKYSEEQINSIRNFINDSDRARTKTSENQRIIFTNSITNNKCNLIDLLYRYASDSFVYNLRAEDEKKQYLNIIIDDELYKCNIDQFNCGYDTKSVSITIKVLYRI